MRDGKLTARVAAVPLADLKRELEAVAPVDIRMATDEVAQFTVTANLAAEAVPQALDYMLREFNFVQFMDTKSGRSVYLVTSLADPNAPRTAAPRDAPALAATKESAIARGSKSPGPPCSQLQVSGRAKRRVALGEHRGRATSPSRSS